MFKMILLILIAGCSLKPYRATLGITGSSSKFNSITKNGDEESTRELCVGNPPDIASAKECASGGYEEFNENSYLEPWLEFMPNYLGNSNFGWSYFFAYNSFKAELLEYPNNGEKSTVRLNRASVNPIIYYNFGDKYITKDKGISFRLGVGVSLNYLLRFEVERLSDQAVHDQNNQFKMGSSAFIEFSWRWFILRVENSSMKFGSRKFSDGPNDDLEIQTNKASLLYSYYFK